MQLSAARARAPHVRRELNIDPPSMLEARSRRVRWTCRAGNILYATPRHTHTGMHTGRPAHRPPRRARRPKAAPPTRGTIAQAITHKYIQSSNTRLLEHSLTWCPRPEVNYGREKPHARARYQRGWHAEESQRKHATVLFDLSRHLISLLLEPTKTGERRKLQREGGRARGCSRPARQSIERGGADDARRDARDCGRNQKRGGWQPHGAHALEQPRGWGCSLSQSKPCGLVGGARSSRCRQTHAAWRR